MKKILIIDDSALMRRVMSDIINSDSEMCVTDTAENGIAAIRLLERGKDYQLILLDINMPQMDGIGFLNYLNEKRIHIPVLLVSSIASRSTEETIRALELGAYDFVKKPECGFTTKEDFVEQILSKAKCAFKIYPEERNEVLNGREVPKILPKTPKLHIKNMETPCELAVIASSTGGPQALQSILPKFPSNLKCPVVIVQHMPAGFTASLAKRLNEMSSCPVKETEDGMKVEAGSVYVAKGGFQLRIEKNAKGEMVFSEKKEPTCNGLRPCADVLLKSLIEMPYQRILCTILTGMGNDATHGLEQLKEKKEIYTIGQSERTCVVYGMPCAMEKAGLSDVMLDLEQIAEEMLKRIN